MLMVMWMKMCFMFRMMIAERSWAMFWGDVLCASCVVRSSTGTSFVQAL